MGIFRGLTPDSICHDPFPHVVIENALDLTLCSELIDSLDNAGPIFDFSKSAPGIKSHIKSRDVLGIELIPHAWKALVKEHIDPLQLKELIAAFTPAIRQLYPFLEHQHGNIEKWTIGQRYVHSAQDFTLLVDAQLSQHAPSPNAFIQERGPHIKMTNKLLICQYLLRLKDDADEGGQYEFFSSRGRNLEFSRDQQIAASSLAELEVKKSVEYAANTAIVFLNSPFSIQAFTKRKTSYPTVYMNLILECAKPLFSLPSPRA